MVRFAIRSVYSRVNLDKRVRDDHPLRRINAALDLSFVRRQVANTYGRRGNKSVPPDVIIRMMRYVPGGASKFSLAARLSREQGPLPIPAALSDAEAARSQALRYRGASTFPTRPRDTLRNHRQPAI
jgi:hypothetical protein